MSWIVTAPVSEHSARRLLRQVTLVTFSRQSALEKGGYPNGHDGHAENRGSRHAAIEHRRDRGSDSQASAACSGPRFAIAADNQHFAPWVDNNSESLGDALLTSGYLYLPGQLSTLQVTNHGFSREWAARLCGG